MRHPTGRHRIGRAIAIALLTVVAMAAMAWIVIARQAAKEDWMIGDIQPEFIAGKCAEPVWPQGASTQQKRLILVDLRIGKDGAVMAAELFRSSGVALFDEAVQAAYLRCRFIPGKRQGAPREMRVRWNYAWTPASMKQGIYAPPVPFAGAPAETRAFLEQAMKADEIADPLKRCLAFPDFPGNQWPAGAAPSLCQLLYGESITLVRVADYVDHGKFAELDALYRRDLDRHFSKSAFSEIIHRDFEGFDGGAEADRVSAKWVQAAPHSAFAQAARGFALIKRAFRVRGQKWAAETPENDMRRAAEIAKSSVASFGKAIALEPRLLPGHVGLMEAGLIGGPVGLGETAFARGHTIDPGCLVLSQQRMEMLEPRWGGSRPAMLAYAAELTALVAARPLLSLALVAPLIDEAEGLYRSGRYADSAKVLEPAAKLAPRSHLFVDLGTSISIGKGDRWAALERLMVAYRFDNDSVKGAQMRGVVLLDVGASAFALKPLRRAVELDPNNLDTKRRLGQAYLAEKEYDLAIPQLSSVLDDPASREYALFQLAYAIKAAKRLGPAVAESALFVASHPESARGWLFHAYLKERQGPDARLDALAAFGSFLKLADSDPGPWGDSIDYARRYIAAKGGAAASVPTTP